MNETQLTPLDTTSQSGRPTSQKLAMVLLYIGGLYFTFYGYVILEESMLATYLQYLAGSRTTMFYILTALPILPYIILLVYAARDAYLFHIIGHFVVYPLCACTSFQLVKPILGMEAFVYFIPPAAAILPPICGVVALAFVYGTNVLLSPSRTITNGHANGQARD